MNRIENGQLSDEHFICQERDGMTLYLPSHSNAAGNDGWNNWNKWFRSRIEDKDGRTISQGFFKFLNLNQENPHIGVTTDDIVDALRIGKPVIATLKYDCSCLIRYVHDGKARFRTRGSFDYQFHDLAEEELEQLTTQYYPMLLDSSSSSAKS
jgi:hypothetical protein